MEASMTEANFSCKKLGMYDIVVLVGFLPKCT
jgi:hypothetical protein